MHCIACQKSVSPRGAGCEKINRITRKNTIHSAKTLFHEQVNFYQKLDRLAME